MRAPRQAAVGAICACLAAGCVAPPPERLSTPVEEEASRFSQVVMDGRDLRGRSFANAQLYRSSFIAANVTGGSFRGAFLASSDLRGVRAVQTDFRQARMAKCSLQGAELMAADFRAAELVAANLYQADLRGASLAGADLTRAVLEGAHLAGTKFGRAKGLSPAMLDSFACWNEETEWPEEWVVEEARRACPTHE